MSNLVNHARMELEHLGCDPDDTDNIIRVIQAFADAGHSGGSAAWSIPIIMKLLMFENLTPLTAAASEWVEVADKVWQSRRRPEAFSDDGGKSYWLLSEGASDAHRHPRHISDLENKRS